MNIPQFIQEEINKAAVLTVPITELNGGIEHIHKLDHTGTYLRLFEEGLALFNKDYLKNLSRHF